MSGSVILHHAPCADGMAAAWVLKRFAHPDADLLPCAYNKPPPSLDVLRDKVVIMADITWPTEDMDAIEKVAARVDVYDHHETAIKRLAPDYVDGATMRVTTPNGGFRMFDKSQSAAGMVSRLFMPDVPQWIMHVEDHDLWRHALPDTPYATAFIHSLPHTLEAYDGLNTRSMSDWPRFVEMGQRLHDLQRETVRVIAANADFKLWKCRDEQTELGFSKKYLIAVAQAPAHLATAVGSELRGYRNVDFAVVWDTTSSGQMKVSLRSNSVNVARIAENYGGGGHAGAAGFVCNSFPWED